MLFITDKATLHSSQIAVRDNPYVTTTLTNISTEQATIEHSDDGKLWETIASLNPTQSTTVANLKKYIKSSQTVYIQSQTTDFTNPVNSGSVNLSNYYTKSEVDALLANAGNTGTTGGASIDAEYKKRLDAVIAHVEQSLDSDFDNLMDAQERELGTNMFKADTDDDGHTDGNEVQIYQTDPLDPNSKPYIPTQEEINEWLQITDLALVPDSDGSSTNVLVGNIVVNPNDKFSPDKYYLMLSIYNSPAQSFDLSSSQINTYASNTPIEAFGFVLMRKQNSSIYYTITPQLRN